MLDFYALAEGLNKRKLVPVTEDVYKAIEGKNHQDWYTSLFNYSSENLETFKKTRSLSGISGLKTNRLIFDFDNSDIEVARQDAVETARRLIHEYDIPRDNLQAFFSGSKGFHLECRLDKFINRQEFVNLVFGIAGDLRSFDTTINDEQRIVRLAHTKHPKSGLYKTPISTKELKSSTIEEIKEKAKVPGEVSVLAGSVTLNDKLIAVKNTEYKSVIKKEKKEVKSFEEGPDFSQAPKWMSHDRYALSQGYFYGSENAEQGERNKAFLILAATFKNQGFSEEHTLALLEVTAEKQALITEETAYTSAQLQKEIINPVFSPMWKGGQYSSDEPLLVTTRERFNLVDDTDTKKSLVKITDVGDRFKSFAKNFDQNRILTGFESLDKKLVLTTGMAVGLLGSPGSGKTSILNSIIENQSKNNIPCIYQSLDMSDNLLYLRLLQKYSGLPVDRILKEFQTTEPDPAILNAYADILKNYSRVHFNFRSAMTVGQIDKDIEAYKKEMGVSPKVIAVDYLEKVRSDYTDPSVSSGMVASQLSDLAKKHDALVIVLLQPQKSAGDASQELLSMRKVKGASVIEQDLRVILTAWRPGFNPQDPYNDRFMSIGVVKNNLGETCQLDFGWKGLTGAITELDMQGKKDLMALRRDLAEKKAGEENDYI